MDLRHLKRGSVLGAATVVAAAGLVLGGGGVASANTTVAQVQSYGCYGALNAAEYNETWNVYASINNLSKTYGCAGWVDISSNGGSTWEGLKGYTWVKPYGTGGTPWFEDGSTVARACVQAANDTIARCSSWW